MLEGEPFEAKRCVIVVCNMFHPLMSTDYAFCWKTVFGKRKTNQKPLAQPLLKRLSCENSSQMSFCGEQGA